jgi:WD40 repeat protein
MGFASDFDPAKKEINKYTGEMMLLIYDPKKLWGNGMNFVLVTSQEKYDSEKARIEELKEQVLAEPRTVEPVLLSAAAPAGATTLELPKQYMCGLGQPIRLNHGETNEEDVIIAGYGPALMLAKPLQHAHAEGEPVMNYAELSALVKAEAGGEDAVGEDYNIVVRDLPKVPGEWKSDTMAATHATVANFTWEQRPVMQVMITRPRSQFGKTCKFSDSGENLQNCRPQKDPNFALQRKELETGIQAVKEVRSSFCQTTWFRPVNKSTQYSPADFLQSESEMKYDQVDALSEFLKSVSVGVEEALQTNETVDIFQEEFSHLGEEDSGAVSKTHSNLREMKNFSDVQYTRNKRIEWVEWIPGSTSMMTCSYCDNLPFVDKVENSGKATSSNVLIWSFRDLLSPHAILASPWEVTVFKFYPSETKFLVGGLSNGQLAIWKLSDADLGTTQRERPDRRQADDEKVAEQPAILHKVLSYIDDSHRKPVVAIEWLPPALEFEKRRGMSEKNPKDGPVKYFATIAGDGLVMIWDILQLLESINDHDFQWRPVHRVQLQRQDSGTEMGLCQLLYCLDRYDDKGNKMLTNFYATTEEGELIFGDWSARAEEDRKPEIIKKLYTSSKSFRPGLSLERSPFFPDIVLSVTDFAFYLWKDGVSEHIFQSSYMTNASNYFTCGRWSPTRPSVVFLGLISGAIDIWDFSDQSHKASLNDVGASVGISSMVFLKSQEKMKEQLMAVGDVNGQLHVHVLPKNLVREQGKEQDLMQKFLDREVERVSYHQDRRVKLADLKEQMEKQAQIAAEKEEVDPAKAAEAEERADQQAEAIYRKLELECKEELGIKLA